MAKYAAEEFICIITGAPNADAHHIRHRGTGGEDVEWNLIYLKHELHQELHAIGLKTFADKYFPFKQWLIDHEWIELSGKWKHGK